MLFRSPAQSPPPKVVRRSPIIFLFCFVLIFCGCQASPVDEKPKQELLIYCGSTMAQAVREMADSFERQEGCVVKMINDGSGNLHHSIHINQVGDLYLPGSEDYIEECKAKKMVIETQRVGFNRAVLLMAKGNPLHISADLNNFVNGTFRTILGGAESGSIGRETQAILEPQGLYARAVKQALLLATDSKDILQAMRAGHADLSINWDAAVLPEDRATTLETLRLDESLAVPHALVLGLLKSSRHPELARRFMAFSVSPEGQKIFARYGFGD